MYKSKDIVTLVSGRTGEFVRYYGNKIQIRLETGEKVTGSPIGPILTRDAEPETHREHFTPPKPEVYGPVIRLGVAQLKIMMAVKKTPQISFRALGIECGFKTQQAATIIKTLLNKGVLIKTQVDGRNVYSVVTP